MSDRDAAEWWAALETGQLLLQRCVACDLLRWPPRAMCPRCGDFGWTYRPGAGLGVVASWIRSHRAFVPDAPVPHVTVLVRLADQPDLLLPGGWAGTAEPAVGQPVRLTGAHLLIWSPADA